MRCFLKTSQVNRRKAYGPLAGHCVWQRVLCRRGKIRVIMLAVPNGTAGFAPTGAWLGQTPCVAPGSPSNAERHVWAAEESHQI